MAIDTSALADYSWSDIAKAAKHAMLSAAVGGAVLELPDRTVKRISIDEARQLYDLANEMIAAEAAGANGLGHVLVKFAEPQ